MISPLDGLLSVCGDLLVFAFPQVAPFRDSVPEEGMYCPGDALGCIPSGLGQGAYLCMSQRLHGVRVVC